MTLNEIRFDLSLYLGRQSHSTNRRLGRLLSSMVPRVQSQVLKEEQPLLYSAMSLVVIICKSRFSCLLKLGLALLLGTVRKYMGTWICINARAAARYLSKSDQSAASPSSRDHHL